MTMTLDPIIEEIHRGRQEHAARFGYDLDKIAEDIHRQVKERFPDLELVSSVKEPRKV